MTDASEVQRLLDVLGPVWRIFHRAGREEEPWWEGVAPRVEVSREPDGALLLEYDVVDGNTIYASRYLDVSVLTSSSAGTILEGRREDGDFTTFSTVTLTPAMRRQVAAYARRPA